MKSEYKNNIPDNRTSMDIYDFWILIWHRKKLVLYLVLFSIVITMFVSFFITPTYRAQSSVMALTTASALSTGNTLSLNMTGLPVGELTNETKRVLAVLNSRTIMENLIKRLDIDKVLTKEKIDDKRLRFLTAIDILSKIRSIIYDEKTGLITVSIEHQNPELARDIANIYIDELQNILISKTFSLSRMKREFIEKQLTLTKEKLEKQQKNLALFQKKTKIIKPMEQAKESMSFYTRLLADKTSLEIKLKSLEMALSPDSPIITSFKNQLTTLSEKIARIEGTSMNGAIPSLGSIPDKIVQYENLNQELEITKSIYETMFKLYEQSKLEEAQEGLFIQVIDPAIKPEGRVSPNRRMMVIIAFIVSIIFSVLLILLLDWIKQIKEIHSQRQSKRAIR